MASPNPIEAILHTNNVVILDGALATELEARGHDLNHPLWSAKVILESAEDIAQLHYDYFTAGADVAITSTYQASIRGLEEHFGMSKKDASELIRTGVMQAQQARQRFYKKNGTHRKLLVAGSIGPYGAYLSDGSEYRGDYILEEKELRDFHRPRIQALVGAEVDLLACETMPSFAEIKSLVAILQEEFPSVPAWFSCTVRDETHLSDGTPLQEVVEFLDAIPQAVAIGINCVPEQVVSATLSTLSRLTTKPLIVYPNSGETWDAQEKVWKGARTDGAALELSLKEWHSKGVRLIGGCCRTNPDAIRTITRAFRNLK